MEEKTPRKTTTRTRPRAATTSARTTALRKRATTTRRAATTTTSTTARKAPTRVVAQPKRKHPVMLYASVVGLLVVFGISSAIGMTDTGQIDVASTIATHLQNAHSSDTTTEAPVVVSTSNQGNVQLIDSGLTPAEVQRTRQIENTTAVPEEPTEETPAEEAIVDETAVITEDEVSVEPEETNVAE